MSSPQIPSRSPKADSLISVIEARGWNWTIGHTARRIEAVIKEEFKEIGVFRPTELHPVSEMLAAAMRAAGVDLSLAPEDAAAKSGPDKIDELIAVLENKGLGWTIDHERGLIEARVWDWPHVTGRYRPNRVEPLADMLAAAMREAGL